MSKAARVQQKNAAVEQAWASAKPALDPIPLAHVLEIRRELPIEDRQIRVQRFEEV